MSSPKTSRYRIAIGAIVFSFGWMIFFAKLIVAAETICPGGSNPDPSVVFCEDFDDGSWMSNPTWATSPFCTAEGREAAECNDASKIYSGACGASSGDNMYFNGEWNYDCKFGSINVSGLTNEAYARIYVKLSPGYVKGSANDKGLYFEGASEDWNMKIQYTTFNDAGPTFASYANSGPGHSEYVYQNQGNDIVLEPGKWYLFEFYIKLNTGNDWNGEVKLWVDDVSRPITTQTLRMHHTDVRMRESSNGIYRFLLHANNNDPGGPGTTKQQWIAWDQLVISHSRIGPMENPILRNKRPAAPVNLIIQ